MREAVDEVGPEQLDLLTRLRRYARAYERLSRHASAAMSLHVPDAEALSEVIRGEDDGAPLSPARLSERTGLTSGATNALVNRLEAAGYVTRSRESTDRRVVTLRSTEAARRKAEAFSAGPAASLAAVLRDAGPEALARSTEVLERLTAALVEIDERLDREAGRRS